MAANIFHSEDYEGIVNRIIALVEENDRRWGKMEIGQMLEHCCLQLRLGLGKITNQGFEGPGVQRTKIGRWLLLYVVPWPKGSPTPSKMNVVKNRIFDTQFHEQKRQLLGLLQEVLANPNLRPHPFFGELTMQDWGRLIWKHLDHHLRQFSG